MSVRQKVMLGMSVLDTKAPDWHWRVNVQELGMQYECNCVLGQLFGGYEKGKRRLNIDDSQAYKLGFLSFFQTRWNLSGILPFVGWNLTGVGNC